MELFSVRVRCPWASVPDSCPLQCEQHAGARVYPSRAAAFRAIEAHAHESVAKFPRGPYVWVSVTLSSTWALLNDWSADTLVAVFVPMMPGINHPPDPNVDWEDACKRVSIRDLCAMLRSHVVCYVRMRADHVVQKLRSPAAKRPSVLLYYTYWLRTDLESVTLSPLIRFQLREIDGSWMALHAVNVALLDYIVCSERGCPLMWHRRLTYFRKQYAARIRCRSRLCILLHECVVDAITPISCDQPRLDDECKDGYECQLVQPSAE
jgi:hypothetical protein